MSEFTSGGWRLLRWNGEEWPEKRFSIASEEGAIAISPRYADLEDESVIANFQLLSAAPELYEALEDVCKQMEYMATWDKHGQSYYKAKRALSKARGEA